MPRSYETSRKLLARARQSLTGGVSSPFRAKFPEPLYFCDGCGPRMQDVDGNSYIDYALAWGPLILGHRHPALVDAMRRQADRPHIYGAQHELEFAVSEKIQQLVPCAERVAFTSSGSEAVQLALRLARAATGRNLILKFDGHYHGWLDSVLIGYRHTGLGSKGQVPNAMENVVIVDWNDLAQVEKAFAEHSIAAVITEPVLCNSGCLMPEPGYLAGLREITRKHGALLIFDEVITGFRMALGGAQEHFGITPDLATFGKAVAGGAPLSVVAGRADVMELMLHGGVSFGGTFNGNPLAMAAAKATLDALSAHDGAALRHANRTGEQLRDGLREKGVMVTGFGTACAVHFTSRESLKNYKDVQGDDKAKLEGWIRGCLDEGIYLLPDGRIYTSAAHGPAEVSETLDAAERVLGRL